MSHQYHFATEKRPRVDENETANELHVVDLR
jgi:hypothetical protein